MPYKNKEKQKQAVKKWKEEHKAQVKKTQHKYYLKHKPKFKKPLKHSKNSRKTTHLNASEYLTLRKIRRYRKNAEDRDTGED